MSSLSLSVPRFGPLASHRLGPIPRQPAQVSLTRRAVPVGASSSASLTSRAPLFAVPSRVTSNPSVVSSNHRFHSTFLGPFSSHARPGDECFSLSLKSDFSGATVSNGWKRTTASEDEELDVFGAEKYFSGDMDRGEVSVNPWKVSENEVISARWNTRSTPPSSFSESRGPSSKRNKLLRAFRLSCYGKSSVVVNQVAKESDDASLETTPVGPTLVEFWLNQETGWWNTDKDGGALRHKDRGNFALPQTPMNRGAGVNLKTTKAMHGSLFTKRFGLTSLAKAEHEVDVCSESSSDLFELDNISTITLAYGVAGGAPREASIDRSVVMAKAAEFSSAMGGWWRFSESARRRQKHQRDCGMPLLGCRSRKAVDVSTSAHRVLVKTGPGKWQLRNSAVAQTSPADLRQSPAKHLPAGRRISAPVPTLSLW